MAWAAGPSRGQLSPVGWSGAAALGSSGDFGAGEVSVTLAK